MVVDDCPIGDDEPAATGIATVAPNETSAVGIALGEPFLVRGISPEGFSRLDLGKTVVGEIEAQLTGETL